VVEIYRIHLNRGRYHSLYPFDTVRSTIDNRRAATAKNKQLGEHTTRRCTFGPHGTELQRRMAAGAAAGAAVGTAAGAANGQRGCGGGGVWTGSSGSSLWKEERETRVGKSYSTQRTDETETKSRNGNALPDGRTKGLHCLGGPKAAQRNWGQDTRWATEK